ncbi:MAG: hypothetical protein AAGE05_01795 [Pseudomonadota bacterium]
MGETMKIVGVAPQTEANWYGSFSHGHGESFAAMLGERAAIGPTASPIAGNGVPSPTGPTVASRPDRSAGPTFDAPPPVSGDATADTVRSAVSTIAPADFGGGKAPFAENSGGSHPVSPPVSDASGAKASPPSPHSRMRPGAAATPLPQRDAKPPVTPLNLVVGGTGNAIQLGVRTGELSDVDHRNLRQRLELLAAETGFTLTHVSLNGTIDPGAIIAAKGG